MNLYKIAAKENYLFASTVGTLVVSDLFDLNLNNLDKVAKIIAKDIKQDGEESFVSTTAVNPTNANKLEIVKDIIADKLAAQQARMDLKAKAEKKARLLEILAKKQDATLESKSEAELLAELQALES